MHHANVKLSLKVTSQFVRKLAVCVSKSHRNNDAHLDVKRPKVRRVRLRLLVYTFSKRVIFSDVLTIGTVNTSPTSVSAPRSHVTICFYM